MRLWIPGAGGVVGQALLQEGKKRGIDVIGSLHRDCDITSLAHVESFVENVQPTHIVNCVAFANVDGAEEEKEKAFSINCEGAWNLARGAKKVGARYLHISTDYVFGGEKRDVPYLETDPCAPVNVYGKSKWEGEKRVMQEYPASCIVRTSWVFGGSKGKNLLSSLLTRFCEQKEVRAVSDQVGNPTYCPDLVDALFSLLDQTGLVHFCNSCGGSRYHVASLLLQEARKYSQRVICKKVVPVMSHEFPTKALRPSYSVLDTSHYTALTGKRPRSFLETAKEFIQHELPL